MLVSILAIVFVVRVNLFMQPNLHPEQSHVSIFFNLLASISFYLQLFFHLFVCFSLSHQLQIVSVFAGAFQSYTLSMYPNHYNHCSYKNCLSFSIPAVSQKLFDCICNLLKCFSSDHKLHSYFSSLQFHFIFSQSSAHCTIT